jgi:hypothetical protein
MSIKVSATPARIALGLLAAAALVPLFALNYRSHIQLDELKRSGVSAIARVTHKQCSNHGQVNYAFSVGDRTFRGYGSCSHSCKDARIGDPVPVTYARHRPRNSECLVLSERQQIIGGNFYMLLVIAGALAVVIFVITRVDNWQRPGNGR